MKNILPLLLLAITLTIALSARAECPSDNGLFCSEYAKAEQGDAEAQAILGGMYDLGKGVAEDDREAVRWYRKAAEQGYAKAQFMLGGMYYLGKGVAEDDREAVRWFRKAAEQGHAMAQFTLGAMYNTGKGVAENDREAVRWFRKAAEQGHAAAQTHLGAKYNPGRGVAEDDREAVRWFRKAAEQGHAEAQAILGAMYDLGKGVAEDDREALRWVRKAAQQGVAEEQYNLGRIYDFGKGVAEDDREALRWYRKAAEQGYAKAQFMLGGMYYLGKGVAEDDREAVRWFRKAAEQGYAGAQAILGAMYADGKGVITDYREAFIWLSIAKVNGSEDAAKALDLTHDRLTSAEIKSARREAAQRLEAIDQGKTNSAENAKLGSNIALAEPPKRADIAEQVFEKAWRSVVVVEDGEGQGSGVILRPNMVATNCHVVDGGGTIVVYKASHRRADTETPFTAVIRHTDTEQDFCLLDVDGLWGIPATVRKYDTLRVGESVYSLGAPQGLDLSLSSGLVSQLRKTKGFRVIQTDAAISPGSSGGGLFDSDGNLVGITTFKFVDKDVEGIGFAIPADLILAY